MITTPLWQPPLEPSPFPSLVGKLEVDVAIVGAGITGLTAGLLLQRAGLHVAILEAETVASGESGHTTAHLSTTLDLGFRRLVSRFGRGDAHQIYESRVFALEQIRLLAEQTKASCSLGTVPQYLFATKAKEMAELEKEIAAATSIGVKAEFVGQVPLPFETEGAMRIPDQAQMDPDPYLRALAKAFIEAGGSISEKTRITNIEDGTKGRGKCTLLSRKLTVRAKDVIVAANVPVNNKLILQTKIAAYRSYAVAGLRAEKLDGLFLDMKDPYHYIRTQEVRGANYLIVGGEDHKTGKDPNAKKRFGKLLDYVGQRFPKTFPITHHWSGQIIEPVDGLPYIGKNPSSHHIYVATGFGGDGMTSGTLSGFILSDLIRKIKNDFAELYDPARLKPFASAKEYLRENVDFPKTLITDRFKRTHGDHVDDVATGEAKIVRQGRRRLAAYRDERGEVHAFSAVCPHMGCYVRWNNAEKSWDCPCHGSRFDCKTGEVLNGPSMTGLALGTA